MKKIVLIVVFLVFGLIGKAQNVMAVYKEQFKISSMEGIEDPQILAALELQLSGMAKSTILIYSKGESIYKEYIENKEQDGFIENSNVTYQYAKGTGSVYKNHKNSEFILQEYILDKSFIITDTIVSYDWKITKEEKIIEGYTCVKAIAGNVAAWYCREIPIPDGPSIYYGLPGLIMEIENETEKIVLTSIDLSYSNNVSLAPPTGKKISRENFQKLLQKKLKNEDFSDDNTTRIKIIK